MAKPRHIDMSALVGTVADAKQSPPPEAVAPVKASKDDEKGIVIRFTYAQWRLLKELSIEEETSIQKITIGALREKLAKDYGNDF